MKEMFLVFLVVTFMMGCSAFRSHKQTLSINCSEPDAYVTVNGNKVDPPAKVDVRRDVKTTLEAKKVGFFPYSKTIDYHFNTTGILDLIGIPFTLVSGIGLLTPGAWSLDETDIKIQLAPEK